LSSICSPLEHLKELGVVHILTHYVWQVVNDDGPPSTTASPYVLDLVRELQSHGHVVSVVLPNTQRSWISKAHIVGQTIKPTYYRPPPPPASTELPESLHYVDTGTVSPHPLGDSSTEEEWVLIDSTPASCVQIGLFHYFKQRGPFDLVISGPNYGRNTTAVFALSSGTLGGALEAAVCGKPAIALSYAFFDKTGNHDPAIVRGATVAGVRVVEWLAQEWKRLDRERGAQVQLYSVNVPLLPGADRAKVLWTRMLQNAWTSGSCFTETTVTEEDDRGPEEEEASIREEGESGGGLEPPTVASHVRYTHKHFKWSPRFGDVYRSVEEAPPGNDGWAVQHGHIRSVISSFFSVDLIELTMFQSVTPLQANFMQVDGFEGEIEL
jgi:tubulin--tyrosine ligase